MLDLRTATAADASAMARIAQDAYAPYPSRMAGQRPAPMDADYAVEVAQADAWVAESDGEVIGFVILVAEDDGLLLDNVAVSPSYQGRGAGRALLALAEERARAGAHERIRLYTHETMVENQALYERIGYVETHRAQANGFSRVFYVKRLDE